MGFHYVNWPDTEPIPQSMEEALALGWESEGFMCDPHEDGVTWEGAAGLAKKVGVIKLYLRIPIRQVFTYGQPFDPRAVVQVPDEGEAS